MDGHTEAKNHVQRTGPLIARILQTS